MLFLPLGQMFKATAGSHGLTKLLCANLMSGQRVRIAKAVVYAVGTPWICAPRSLWLSRGIRKHGDGRSAVNGGLIMEGRPREGASLLPSGSPTWLLLRCSLIECTPPPVLPCLPVQLACGRCVHLVCTELTIHEAEGHKFQIQAAPAGTFVMSHAPSCSYVSASASLHSDTLCPPRAFPDGGPPEAGATTTLRLHPRVWDGAQGMHSRVTVLELNHEQT